MEHLILYVLYCIFLFTFVFLLFSFNFSASFCASFLSHLLIKFTVFHILIVCLWVEDSITFIDRVNMSTYTVLMLSYSRNTTTTALLVNTLNTRNNKFIHCSAVSCRTQVYLYIGGVY